MWSITLKSPIFVPVRTLAGNSIGAPDIVSVPPAKIKFASPALIAETAFETAFIPEPQTIFKE